MRQVGESLEEGTVYIHLASRVVYHRRFVGIPTQSISPCNFNIFSESELELHNSNFELTEDSSMQETF